MIEANYILQAFVRQPTKSKTWVWRDVGVYDTYENAAIHIPTGGEHQFRVMYRGEEVVR